MKIITNKKYIGSQGRESLYDIYYTEEKMTKQVILFCHGFKGFKDFGCFPIMYKWLAERGYVVVTFNFSHNGGTTTDYIDFPDLEAFSLNTYSKELADVQAIIKCISQDNFIENQPIDVENIHILGHSRGGGIAIVSALQHKNIKSVGTLGAISTFDRFPKDEKLEYWKKNNVVFVENKRTLQQMPLQYILYEDYMENKTTLDIENAAKNLQKPFLILHGSADETVAVAEAKILKSWSTNAQLEIIEHANHTFGSTQPWKDNFLPSDFEKALNFYNHFLQKNS